MNKNCEREHSYLISNLKGKTFHLVSLSMMLGVRFFIDALYQVEEVLFLFSDFVKNHECMMNFVK